MLTGMIALLALNGQLYVVDTFHYELRRGYEVVRSYNSPVSNRW